MRPRKIRQRLRRACDWAVFGGHTIVDHRYGVHYDAKPGRWEPTESPDRGICPLGALILGTHTKPRGVDSAVANALLVSRGWVRAFLEGYDGRSHTGKHRRAYGLGLEFRVLYILSPKGVQQ